MEEKRDGYRFSNALGSTFEQLAEMHNMSFTGYFLPISMTPPQVADFWRINQIDATRCVIMHDVNGAFVGMARMGTRATRGWCGGFGIVPAFRGTGASKMLAYEMVRVARDSGLAQLQLEVLSQNSPARKLYENVGFVTQRRLFSLEIATSALPDTPLSSYTFERVPIETLLSWSQKPAAQPCWGNELISLFTIGSEMLVMRGSDARSNAIIAQRSGDKIRIQTAFLQSELTDVELATLLRTIARDAPMIQVFNEPEESPLVQRYLSLGMTEFVSQYEMTLKF